MCQIFAINLVECVGEAGQRAGQPGEEAGQQYYAQDTGYDIFKGV